MLYRMIYSIRIVNSILVPCYKDKLELEFEADSDKDAKDKASEAINGWNNRLNAAYAKILLYRIDQQEIKTLIEP